MTLSLHIRGLWSSCIAEKKSDPGSQAHTLTLALRDNECPLAERDRSGLRGSLPSCVISFKQQYARLMESYWSLEKEKDTVGQPEDVVALAKWRILNRLHDSRNETLYNRVAKMGIIQPLRCSCHEKEVDIFEKDFGITDLSDHKAQVVSISSMVEQLRLHESELDHGKSQFRWLLNQKGTLEQERNLCLNWEHIGGVQMLQNLIYTKFPSRVNDPFGS